MYLDSCADKLGALNSIFASQVANLTDDRCTEEEVLWCVYLMLEVAISESPLGAFNWNAPFRSDI